MSVDQARAMSFGAVAHDYDRLRPAPAGDAVEWLVPEGCHVAVDLAAGTGLLSRALQRTVPVVVAVEPDARMRQVLTERSPGVVVLEGRGESIPIDDAAADALFVSSAWHWLEPERAVPEIARVLRDEGRFGVIWTSRDRDVPWVRELDAARATLRDHLPGGGHRDLRWPPRREVELPEDAPFGRAETAAFTYRRRMPVSDVVAMYGTYSGIITAGDSVRATVLDEVRRLIERAFPGQTEIDVPIRSHCWRAERMARA